MFSYVLVKGGIDYKCRVKICLVKIGCLKVPIPAPEECLIFVCFSKTFNESSLKHSSTKCLFSRKKKTTTNNQIYFVSSMS